MIKISHDHNSLLMSQYYVASNQNIIISPGAMGCLRLIMAPKSLTYF